VTTRGVVAGASAPVPLSVVYDGRDHLIIPPGSLVFYVDDSGDEKLGDRNHPIFAFGGVACVAEFHWPISAAWQAMKANVFPQIDGPLHASTHLRENRLSNSKRAALIDATAPTLLGRFGTIITSQTIIPLDDVVQVACLTLTNRLTRIAKGVNSAGLWAPAAGGELLLVFEHSSRLATQIERYLLSACCDLDGLAMPLTGCFMPKSVANPFLEMADFVVNTIARNVKWQLAKGRASCTPNFQALFRDVGPPLADYFEVTHVQ
jgi:hypothetical protein